MPIRRKEIIHTDLDPLFYKRKNNDTYLLAGMKLATERFYPVRKTKRRDAKRSDGEVERRLRPDTQR